MDKRRHPKKRNTDWVRSVRNFFVLYFERARIHGFSYFGLQYLQWIEKLFWLVLVAMAFCATITISLKSLKRYETKSTVVSIERDHYYWNTSLPSFTICETTNRIDKDLFDAYCEEKSIVGQTKQEFYEFIESMANATYESFHLIKDYSSIDSLRIKPEQYMSLIQQLTKDQLRTVTEYVGVRAYRNKENIRCERVLTEQGICYMSNNFLAPNLSDIYILTGEQPEPLSSLSYYEGHDMVDVITGNLFDGDKTYNMVGFRGNKVIYVHSPYETINIAKVKYSSKHSFKFWSSATETLAEEGFQKHTSISQRNCRFTSESNLTHFPIYTRGLCLQECRLNMVYDLCGCIPHFYPNRIPNPKPVCHYKSLKSCVYNHKRVLLELRNEKETRTNCQCLQNCVGSDVYTSGMEELVDANELLGTTGAIAIVQDYPLVRYKRRILFSLTDLFVSIGATASFFTGFCVLGIIEVFYFFTLRLFWHLLGRKIEPTQKQITTHENKTPDNLTYLKKRHRLYPTNLYKVGVRGRITTQTLKSIDNY